MWTLSDEASSDDESKCCNHTCCKHCGYKQPIDYDGRRWKHERSFLVNGERLYRNDLEALIKSCCPKDKRQLSHEIEYCIVQDAYDVLEDLPRLGYNKITPLINNKQQTAIHLAFYKKAHDTLNYSDGSILFKLYKDHVNYVDCYGLSHLHIACVTGDIEVVRQFLDENEDINARYHSDPDGTRIDFAPLHFAATNECKDIVELLLQRGANVNAKDSMGRTPLHLACGVTETFDRWLEGMGQVNCLESSFKFEIIELLLKHGGDANAKDKQGNTPLFYCLQKFNVNTSGVTTYKSKKLTELRNRQANKFELLLKHGADITVTNNSNENIIYWIVKNLQSLRLPIIYSDISFDDTPDAELIERILAVNKELDVNAQNSHGETPLHLAISLMSVEVIKVLLKYNSDFNSIKSSQKEQIQFMYPNIPPNLEAVQNMMSMIELLSDKEYNFSLEDNLAIMKLLVHNCENCDCILVKDEKNVKYIIVNALYHAPPCHLNYVAQNLQIFPKRLGPHHQDKLQEYIYFYLDCKRKLGLFDKRGDLNKPKNFEYSNQEIKALIKNLNSEVARMKSTNLNSGITLYNMMTEGYSKIYEYIKDSNIDKLLINFPSYEKLIKSHIAKSLIRNYIEKTACQYLKLPSLQPLPNICWKMIVSYLTNEDILNLSTVVTFSDSS